MIKNTKNRSGILLTIASSIFWFAGCSNAAVIYTPSGNDLLVTIDADIVFVSTVTVTDDDFFGVAFENAYSSDQTELLGSSSSPSMPVISVSIDSVTNTTANFFQGLDSGDSTFRDFRLNLRGWPTSVTITPGEVIVIPAGQYAAQNYLGFGGSVPDLVPTTAHFWTRGGFIASNSVPVPEPESALLIVVGSLTLASRRTGRR